MKAIKRFFMVLVSMFLVSAAFAVDPTDIAGLMTDLETKQTTVQTYAVWGLFLVAGIVVARVLISWFRAAKTKG